VGRYHYAKAKDRFSGHHPGTADFGRRTGAF
jgi:hypothetical protein